MADLMRWEPVSDMFELRDDMNRLLGDFFMTRKEKAMSKLGWMPSVDVSESENEYTIKADIPGMKKEDIKISLERNTMSISGERKEEVEEKNKNYVRREKSYGSFFRSFELPHAVDSKNIKATYSDGVLSINVPKSEESKPKEIKIDVK